MCAHGIERALPLPESVPLKLRGLDRPHETWAEANHLSCHGGFVGAVRWWSTRKAERVGVPIAGRRHLRPTAVFRRPAAYIHSALPSPLPPKGEAPKMTTAVPAAEGLPSKSPAWQQA